MEARIDEIASGVYRLSIFAPETAPPAGLTYNHFLITGDEPLLFHVARWQADGEREDYTETLTRIERRLSSCSPRELRNKLTVALIYDAIFKPAPRLFKLRNTLPRIRRMEFLLVSSNESYHNVENGFCVLRAKARGHRDVVTVVGHAATIAAGEWITASGEWVNDRTHGQRFKARFLRTSPPRSSTELFSVCGVKPGLSDDAPRRFIRLGNPFLFSRVLQRGFELLAVQASFKGDLLYGSICSLIIGNVPSIDQSPHKLYRSLPLHPSAPV